MHDTAHLASDERLAAAARAGDVAAFSELHSRWAGRLCRFFTARLSAANRADAGVLAADTLSEAWLSLRNEELKVPDHFGAWIHKIAYRRLMAYWNLNEPVILPEIALVDAVADPGDPATWLTFREAEKRASWPAFAALLRDSIDSLPWQYRPVLRASLGKFLASQPPDDEEPLRGALLAVRAGITRRQADKLRSEGLRQLHAAVIVTAMARGYDGTEPCARFRYLVRQSDWARRPPGEQGPLGEQLCGSLNKHVAQCATCTATTKRLRTTQQLMPVLNPLFGLLVLMILGLLGAARACGHVTTASHQPPRATASPSPWTGRQVPEGSASAASLPHVTVTAMVDQAIKSPACGTPPSFRLTGIITTDRHLDHVRSTWRHSDGTGSGEEAVGPVDPGDARQFRWTYTWTVPSSSYDGYVYLVISADQGTWSSGPIHVRVNCAPAGSGPVSDRPSKTSPPASSSPQRPERHADSDDPVDSSA